MGETTAISWTDSTWNPWWGCTKIEAPNGEGSACDNCYAASTAKRYGHDIWGKDADRRELSDDNWRKPLKWDREAAEAGRPRLVFCASMCDVFEHRVPDDLERHRVRLWELIEGTPHLVWQLLTKRPEWIPSMVPRAWMHGGWPENVWAGVTVEAARFARIRLPRLLRVPAPVLFVSMEPLLGEVDLGPWLERLGWVIVGGESGSPRRELDHDAVRRIRDDCARERVPFFFKQTSGPKAGMPGPDDLAVRQFPPQACRAA